VVSRLLECHERIRRFTAMATRLAGALEAPAAQVVEAAAQLERYFATALPLHVADEDGTVLPRLLAAGPDGPVREALEQMEQEHRLIDALLLPQLEAWRRLQAQPGQLPALAPGLVERALRLGEAMEPHLQREERIVFPALERLLPRALQEQLVGEMLARRGASAGGEP
jgi:iron-sulfur cluster repair protein YtfE (RIC family)